MPDVAQDFLASLHDSPPPISLYHGGRGGPGGAQGRREGEGGDGGSEDGEGGGGEGEGGEGEGEGEDGAGLYSSAALRAEEAPLHLACTPITAPMQSSLFQP